MSGSSNADHSYSRCQVFLDSGVSIDWAPDPDGSFDSGAQHHQQEEAGFRGSFEKAAHAIEVLFDEMESKGHVFVTPDAPEFSQAQRGTGGTFPSLALLVACTPPLSREELVALVARVVELVLPKVEQIPGDE